MNYPGAFVKIESTSYEYQRIMIYAAQLSQSAYLALQLPYIVFGLGSTANFVDHLTVGISAITTNNAIVGYKKEWPQIIPNSQLVINPNPRDYTYK
jgi:integrin alpha FG-GAP repeat containing protein 1